MKYGPGMSNLEVRDAESDHWQTVIETPRGSRNKFKYDEKHGVFKLHKLLPLGAVFPYDFGFFPATQSQDGDPLDVLVLLEEAVFVGCVVPVQLLGVLEAEQTEDGKTVRNDRLIAVADTMFHPPRIQHLDDLGKQRLDEIEHFFVSYNRLENRVFKPLHRRGPAQAAKLVEEAIQRFKQK